MDSKPCAISWVLVFKEAEPGPSACCSIPAPLGTGQEDHSENVILNWLLALPFLSLPNDENIILGSQLPVQGWC